MGKTKVLKIGNGFIEKIAETLYENNIRGKLLYVSDFFVDRLYGEKVKNQLVEIGKVNEEIVDRNTIAYSMKIAEKVIATDIDCILAMGGGKVLDVCKYAAYIAKKPLLSLPTTIANDGIASPIAVLKREDGKPKSLGCAAPSMLILDTGIALESPIELIKAGIGDTISNYMALKDWNLACKRKKDEMNGYAYIMSKTSLEVLMHTQSEKICKGFIEVLANSLVLSGIAMDYVGSSRPVSGSEHLFSHALDYYSTKKNLHGLQVALGTIAMLKVVGEDAADVIGYLKKFNVEINPLNMGIDEELFITCIKNATKMRSNRYTYLQEADLSINKLSGIYRELAEEL